MHISTRYLSMIAEMSDWLSNMHEEYDDLYEENEKHVEEIVKLKHSKRASSDKPDPSIVAGKYMTAFDYAKIISGIIEPKRIGEIQDKAISISAITNAPVGEVNGTPLFLERILKEAIYKV